MSTTTEKEKEGEPDSLAEILVFKMEEFIDEKFHDSFFEKKDLQEILTETLNLVGDLNIVHSKVVPCFPPKYNIFNLYKELYLKHIYNKIQPFINEEDLQQTPGSLIVIAKWLDQFTESLRKVSVDIKTTEIGSVNNIFKILGY
jgi:hypothetical protein